MVDAEVRHSVNSEFVTLFGYNAHELIHDVVTNTKHFNEERLYRAKEMEELMYEDEQILDMFSVDRHHKAGREIHLVTESAMIIVLNERKLLKDLHNSNHGGNSLVTVKLARPGQLVQLYGKSYLIPEDLLEKARYNQINHFNSI